MPIHNIFKKRRKNSSNLKRSKKLPKIIIDIHEKNSLIPSELGGSDQVKIEIRSLKIGDYLIGNTIIERKTIQDFINSMINKRLISQLRQMQKYKNKILIVEGTENNFFKEIYKKDTKLNDNSLRGFLLSISLNYKTQIIFTEDYEDTSKYLIILAKQQLKQKTPITLHSKIPKTIKEQKQYIIEAFPNIGPITAKKLLEKFKTISNVICASRIKKNEKKNKDDLKKILKSRTLNFINLINSKE